jgi:hypothetical protein
VLLSLVYSKGAIYQFRHCGIIPGGGGDHAPTSMGCCQRPLDIFNPVFIRIHCAGEMILRPLRILADKPASNGLRLFKAQDSTSLLY